MTKHSIRHPCAGTNAILLMLAGDTAALCRLLAMGGTCAQISIRAAANVLDGGQLLMLRSLPVISYCCSSASVPAAPAVIWANAGFSIAHIPGLGAQHPARHPQAFLSTQLLPVYMHGATTSSLRGN